MSNLKKILALVLSLALTVCVCLALFSCGDNDPDDDTKCTSHTDADKNGVCDNDGCGATVEVEPEGTTYTVTVTDENGTPVQGVVLTIGTTSNKSDDLTTNEQGKASAALNITGVAKIRATVKSVPAGFKAPTSAEMFEQGTTTLTVVLERENNVTHTVRLVDANGNAITLAGVEIMICQQVCWDAVATDANGVANVTFEPVEMELKIKIRNIDDIAYTYAEEPALDGYVHIPYGTDIELVLKAK